MARDRAAAARRRWSAARPARSRGRRRELAARLAAGRRRLRQARVRSEAESAPTPGSKQLPRAATPHRRAPQVRALFSAISSSNISLSVSETPHPAALAIARAATFSHEGRRKERVRIGERASPLPLRERVASTEHLRRASRVRGPGLPHIFVESLRCHVQVRPMCPFTVSATARRNTRGAGRTAARTRRCRCRRAARRCGRTR